MRNEFTEGEEAKYREAMWERHLVREQQMREDAMDCFDVGEEDDDEDND